MSEPFDFEALIARIREEAARPEYRPLASEPPLPLAPAAPVAAAAANRPESGPFPSPIQSIRAPASVDDLLLIADPDAFVEQAYRTLLRRPADPSGMAHYRGQLADGGRMLILCALRASPEGRALGVKLPGFGVAPLFHRVWHLLRLLRLPRLGNALSQSYQRWRQSRMALSGRAFVALAERELEQAARMARLEQALDAAGQRQDARLSALDARLGALSERVPGLDARVGALSERVPALDARVEALSEQVPGLDARVGALSEQVPGLDARVGALSEQVPGLDARLGALSEQVPGLDARVGALSEQVPGLDARVGALSEQVPALDARVGALSEQVPALDARLGALSEQVPGLDARLGALSEQVPGLDARLGALSERVPAQDGRLAAVDTRLDTLAGQIRQHWEGQGGVQAELGVMRARLKVLQQRVLPEFPASPPAMPAAASDPDTALARRIDAFYLAFEEVHRGSEPAIAEGLAHYLQDIAALPDELLASPMLDLGCGRGEWLRLLREQGFVAAGVDLNPDMVARARGQGLDVRHQDALSGLAELPDASRVVISAFHLVEHLPFDQLFQMLEQAWRVLVPGGLLILETPNPENVLVGSHTFYHDFSHRNPITPTALRFLVGYHGFVGPRLRRLHPYPEEARVATDTRLGDRVNGHLYGPQDYALIANRPR